MFRISDIGKCNKFFPLKEIDPETTRPGGVGIKRKMESAVTDFPQPLSPTMPKVFPSGIAKETSSTAKTSPSSVRKAVRKFFTSKITLLIDYSFSPTLTLDQVRPVKHR